MDVKGNFRREEVLRLYAEGQSVTEILELVDMSYDSVLRILKKNGLYKSKAETNTVKQTNHIVKLLNENSAIEVAKQTQLPVTIVNAIKQKSGKDIKQYKYAGKIFDTYAEMNAYKTETGVEIRKLSAEGVSNEMLAKKFNLSLLSVARFID